MPSRQINVVLQRGNGKKIELVARPSSLISDGVLPKNIMFLNLICAPEGLKKLKEVYPEVSTIILMTIPKEHLNF